MSLRPLLFMPFFLSLFAAGKPMNILVQPPQNQGDGQYQWLAAGFCETIVSDLSRIESVRVITEEDRRKALKEMALGQSGLADEATTARLGRLLGANVIFTGSYQVSGTSVRVVARIVNVEGGNVESSVKVDGQLDKIFDLQDRIVASLMGEATKLKVRDAAPAVWGTAEAKRQSEVWKPSAEAFEHHARGLQASHENPKEALALFQKACALEPEYADAWLRCGMYLPNAREAMAALEKAAAILVRSGETESSRMALIQKVLSYRALDAGDHEKAKAVLKPLLAWFEGRREKSRSYHDSLFVAVKLHSKIGDYAVALEHANKLESVARSIYREDSPEFMTDMVMCANVHTRLGDYESALRYFETAASYYGRKTELGKSLYLLERSEYHRRLKQFDEAVHCCNEGLAILEQFGRREYRDYATMLRMRGDVLKEKGDRRNAALSYRSASELFGRTGDAKSKDMYLKMADSLSD